MEFSKRTNYIVDRLAVSVIDTVENFIDANFENRFRYFLIIDDNLNVICIDEDEALRNNKYELSLILNNFINIEYEDNSTILVGVDMDKCEALAAKYAPLIEFGVVNSSKW